MISEISNTPSEQPASDEPFELAQQVEEFLTVWFAVRQLIQSLNFNRFQREGLSATQFILMQLLDNVSTHQPPTISGLAHRLNLDPATVVRTVDSLEKRGLVQRRRDKVDRRLVFVEFTEEGRTTQQSMHQSFKQRLITIFGAMSPQKRVALLVGLNEFMAVSRKLDSENNQA